MRVRLKDDPLIWALLNNYLSISPHKVQYIYIYIYIYINIYIYIYIHICLFVERTKCNFFYCYSHISRFGLHPT